MISEYTYKDLKWIDSISPTQNEIDKLMEEYKLPPLVARELLTETLRSRVDLYENLIYLILHFPTIEHDEVVIQEIDFIIGKDFLITIHYNPIEKIHQFKKFFQYEMGALLEEIKVGNHAGYIFFHIIRELYQDSALILEQTDIALQNIEKEIFDGKETQMVHVISNLNRKLLDFKQAIRYHNDVLKSFEHAADYFFGKEFSYHLSAVMGEHNKVVHIIESNKEILNDLRDTNDSLLSTKTTEVMKNLTVMAFIMLPLTLIAGVFGMNADFFLIQGIDDFIFIVGAMVLTGLLMFTYFKLKKWF